MHDLHIILLGHYQFASRVLRDFILRPSGRQNALWVKHKADTPPGVHLLQSTVKQLFGLSDKKLFNTAQQLKCKNSNIYI